jgi:phospholipid/cholesterol/gamma-HCH transport system permease protein
MGRKTKLTSEPLGPGAGLTVTRQKESLVLVLSGNWKLSSGLPSVSKVEEEIKGTPPVVRVAFETTGLSDFDTGLIVFLTKVTGLCSQKKIEVVRDGLPQGAQRLLALAEAVPERKGARREGVRIPFLSKVGDRTIGIWRSLASTLEFLGEVTVSFLRLFGGKARFRLPDLWLIMQECGAQALVIVSVMSFLIGLILAFVGAMQLKLFGAQIFVAPLVGISMVRSMGAIMAGIIMSGRTGASFAAQIGTMQVNEEIDALRTAGIPPMDFLVLPRVLALSLMMPLLTLYADFMGILGGLFVGVVGLDIGFMEYYNATKQYLNLTNFAIGIFSGLTFGVLVALAGCMRGMQCGRSASAVGDATRSSVVTGIVSIVVATAIITVLCTILGLD